jgi:uncharacterized lipoprotein
MARRVASNWAVPIVAVLLLLTGCAFTPAELELRPQVRVPDTVIGEGTAVSFRFIDDRDDVTIGHRSVATVGAKISAQQLPATVERILREILTEKHYRIVADQNAAAAEVTYRLRSFKFEIETGFFTGGRNSSAVLTVEARRRGQEYSHVYRDNSETRILVVPGEADINQQMNAALSRILTEAANDNDLDRFLTQK